jgi:hypothetical protein
MKTQVAVASGCVSYADEDYMKMTWQLSTVAPLVNVWFQKQAYHQRIIVGQSIQVVAWNFSIAIWAPGRRFCWGCCYSHNLCMSHHRPHDPWHMTLVHSSTVFLLQQMEGALELL